MKARSSTHIKVDNIWVMNFEFFNFILSDYYFTIKIFFIAEDQDGWFRNLRVQLQLNQPFFNAIKSFFSSQIKYYHSTVRLPLQIMH